MAKFGLGPLEPKSEPKGAVGVGADADWGDVGGVSQLFDDSSRPLTVDLGCGYGCGDLSYAACAQWEGDNVLGCDLSAGGVQFARGLASRWRIGHRGRFARDDARAVLRRVRDAFVVRPNSTFAAPTAGHFVLAEMCDAAARNSWSLYLFHGCLYRHHRNANGELDFEAPPPEGWPNGDCTRVVKDEAGLPTDLCYRAIGAVIEVIFDHDKGTLSFHVNDGPLLDALKGKTTRCKFPKGAALRPFACCPLVGDRLRLVTPFL